jgi:hypothetical protein
MFEIVAAEILIETETESKIGVEIMIKTETIDGTETEIEIVAEIEKGMEIEAEEGATTVTDRILQLQLQQLVVRNDP